MENNFNQQLVGELAEIEKAGMMKVPKIIAGRQGAEITVGKKKFLNFCANNYLGLAGSNELGKVATQGFKEHGFGMASVRFICGTGTVHTELEKEIAKFFSLEDAILYGSCFDANAGLFETILAEGDAVFSDELNHASIIDGIRLCKAERFRYKHSDMSDLEANLLKANSFRRRLIVTDGVFSMDGETARLKEISVLAKKYDALLMVDDSHGSGVLGKKGRGSPEACGITPDILTSTFGKALGGAGGGFTAGSKELVEYLRQRSRPYLFSNTLIPAVAHAALYVLKNFNKKFLPLQKKVTENTKYFRAGLQKLGFTLGGDGTHPITPVFFPDEQTTVKAADVLYEKGIYVRAFTYPVVPKGKARIRVQLSAAHTKRHLDRALGAFEAISS